MKVKADTRLFLGGLLLIVALLAPSLAHCDVGPHKAYPDQQPTLVECRAGDILVDTAGGTLSCRNNRWVPMVTAQQAAAQAETRASTGVLIGMALGGLFGWVLGRTK